MVHTNLRLRFILINTIHMNIDHIYDYIYMQNIIEYLDLRSHPGIRATHGATRASSSAPASDSNSNSKRQVSVSQCQRARTKRKRWTWTHACIAGSRCSWRQQLGVAQHGHLATLLWCLSTVNTRSGGMPLSRKKAWMRCHRDRSSASRCTWCAGARTPGS